MSFSHFTAVPGSITNNCGSRVFTGVLKASEAWHIRTPNEEALKTDHLDGELSGFGGPTQRPLNLTHSKNISVYYISAAINSLLKSGALTPDETDLAKALYDYIRPGTRTNYIVAPLVLATTSPDAVGTVLPTSHGHDIVPVNFKKCVILDGQHRTHAFGLAQDAVREIVKSQAYDKGSKLLIDRTRKDRSLAPVERSFFKKLDGALDDFTFAFQLSLDLNPEDMGSGFYDLNELKRPVEKAVSLSVNSNNPINNFNKSLPEYCPKIRIEAKKNSVGFDAEDQGKLTLKELETINSLVIYNKTNSKMAKVSHVSKQHENAMRFWRSIESSPNFGDTRAKDKTLLAQPVMIQALAKLAYDLTLGRDANPENFNKLLKGIEMDRIGFNHSNQMFRYYSLTDKQRREYGLTGLADYLPKFDDSVAREIGSADASGKWHFNQTKTNDVRPILGDMIRWKLGLPPRNHKVAVAK